MGAEEPRPAGRLTATDIERVFIGPAPCHTRLDVARAAGVPQDLAERIWRALGFATQPDDAVAFTDADVAALERVRAILAEDLMDERTVIRLARALGQTTARLAQWQAEIMINATLGPDASDEDLARVLVATERLLPDFEAVLVHVWRAQLAAVGTRLLAVADRLAEPGGLAIAVGFADLVAFTRFSRDLDERGLAELVEGFETRASDVVAAHGARLVKTLGDEILFTARDARTAAVVALDLVEMVKRNRDGPDVRVGLAYGPVVPMMGDVFGTTVNLASRLTTLARPGTILVDAAMAHALEGVEDLALHRIRRRPARGLGVVQPYVLRGSPRAECPSRAGKG